MRIPLQSGSRSATDLFKISCVSEFASGPVDPHGENAMGCAPHPILVQEVACLSILRFSAAFRCRAVCSWDKGYFSAMKGHVIVTSTHRSLPLSVSTLCMHFFQMSDA